MKIQFYLNKLKQKGFNDEQIEFIKTLLLDYSFSCCADSTAEAEMVRMIKENNKKKKIDKS